MTEHLLGNPLLPIQSCLELMEIRNPAIARWICKLIPGRCPFERKIYLLGRMIYQIPPLCKLNPFYKQFVMLRLKALAYLAEHDN
jgi:Mo-dependent nitrogenase C-terminus